MTNFNIFNAECKPDPGDPEGYRAADYRFQKDIGASMLTGRVWELPPGESNCPYHYEYNNEEWLILLQGELSVRTPGDGIEMAAGDVVCFPAGPEGAHKLTNNGEQTARFLFISTDREPAVAVYPDSDKIGIWPGGDGNDDLMVERSSTVDYWSGEK